MEEPFKLLIFFPDFSRSAKSSQTTRVFCYWQTSKDLILTVSCHVPSIRTVLLCPLPPWSGFTAESWLPCTLQFLHSFVHVYCKTVGVLKCWECWATHWLIWFDMTVVLPKPFEGGEQVGSSPRAMGIALSMDVATWPRAWCGPAAPGTSSPSQHAERQA